MHLAQQTLQMLSWTDAETWCYPIFRCQTEFILFLQSKDIRDMKRKWFTATKAFMACNALPITRSRQLFIINVRERKLKEEKKQLAVNKNKKAGHEIACSHRHDSTVINRLSLYLYPLTQQLNPTSKVSPYNYGNYHFTKISLLFSPEHWAHSLSKKTSLKSHNEEGFYPFLSGLPQFRDFLMRKRLA